MYSVRDHPKVGFPHSEIFGSKPVRGSPKLIAAYHVLLRLLAPRHPPNALLALDQLLHLSKNRRSTASWARGPLSSPSRAGAIPRPRNSILTREVVPPGSALTRTARRRPRRQDLCFLSTMSQNHVTKRTTSTLRTSDPLRQLPPDSGGGERDRTDDLLLAKQALSQLSYTPRFSLGPRSPALRINWWAREDLNLRPHAYQARALTN